VKECKFYRAKIIIGIQSLKQSVIVPQPQFAAATVHVFRRKRHGEMWKRKMMGTGSQDNKRRGFYFHALETNNPWNLITLTFHIDDALTVAYTVMPLTIQPCSAI